MNQTLRRLTLLCVNMGLLGDIFGEIRMESYILTATVTVSARIEVKAPSLEEAINKSKDLPVIHELESDETELSSELSWVVTEFDGSPENIRLE